MIASFHLGARARTLLVLIAAASGVTGCASQQRIPLESTKAASPASPTVATVSLVDARSKQDREFHLGGHPHCYRSYGDDSFVPPKVEYLRHVVEAKAPSSAKVQLKVSRFETIEYCDGSVERTRPSGLAATVAGVTGGKVLLPVDPPKGIKGDRFTLHLAGTVDGTPFDISEEFDYDDIKFTNFPAESSEYRQRIERAIDAAVDQLFKVSAADSANAASNNRGRGP